MPPILQLVRMPTVGSGLSRPYGEAAAAVNVIGMAAITGLPETWLLEAHWSFASIEDLDRGLSTLPVRSGAASDPLLDDVLWSTRTMIALYRPGWSYRPADALRLWARARYVHVSILRIRPGTESEPGYARGPAAAPAKESAKIASESEIPREDLLFRIGPRISRVSDAFAESDQEFWRGRPAK